VCTIPKDNGKTRPIGISTIEDKVVQNALNEVLGTIYEQDFLECSYGFPAQAKRARRRTSLDPGGGRRRSELHSGD
jgi:hypothetical protein